MTIEQFVLIFSSSTLLPATVHLAVLAHRVPDCLYEILRIAPLQWERTAHLRCYLCDVNYMNIILHPLLKNVFPSILLRLLTFLHPLRSTLGCPTVHQMLDPNNERIHDKGNDQKRIVYTKNRASILDGSVQIIQIVSGDNMIQCITSCIVHHNYISKALHVFISKHTRF